MECLSLRQSYRNFKFDEHGEKIKLTQAEFLSDFRKGDKLIPMITAVIYFGSEKWDAPMSIHEMLDVNERLLPFILNYRINLIAPANIEDGDFDSKFHTGFGTLLNAIKHQNSVSVADILRRAGTVDSASADMIAEIANVKFERVTDKKGEVDMCKGMEEYTLKTKILGAIEAFKLMGKTEEEIIQLIAENYHVTVDYVKNLLLPMSA